MPEKVKLLCCRFLENFFADTPPGMECKKEVKSVKLSLFFVAFCPPVKTLYFPAISLKITVFSEKMHFSAEKTRKKSKNDLQSSKTMIYYISVAPLEGGCSEADIKHCTLANLPFFEKSGFEKKRKKIQKLICKVQKR